MKKTLFALSLLALSRAAFPGEIFIGEAADGKSSVSILQESIKPVGPNKISFVISERATKTGNVQRRRVVVTGCADGGGEYLEDGSSPDYWTTPSPTAPTARGTDVIARAACAIAYVIKH